MKDNIKINAQSSIRIMGKDKIYYIDPYLIRKKVNDADYIFITHDHYDHLSEEDIRKVIKNDTIIIVPESCYQKIDSFNLENEVFTVKPNNKYSLEDLLFETVGAYNIDKLYHAEINNWVGYNIEIDNIKYFITGDTDINKDNKLVKCDVLLIPVGGTYTMDYNQAALLTNLIKPRLAIPTHYKTVVGSKKDAKRYVELLDKGIEYSILY